MKTVISIITLFGLLAFVAADPAQSGPEMRKAGKVHHLTIFASSPSIAAPAIEQSTNGDYVTEFVWLPESLLPSLPSPPAGWDTNAVPSGQPAPYFDYQEFLPNQFGTNQLFWQRAYFFVPTNTFNVMVLDTNNWWQPTGITITGPREYLDISMADGDGLVERLVAQ